MEFLQQKLEQLKATWNALSGSGRLALVMVVLLVVTMLLIVAQNSGGPDLAPLPVQFATDELEPAVKVLQAKQIEYEVRGNQIFVPADMRPMCLGLLATGEAISADSDIDIDQLFNGSSMWTSDKVRDSQLRYLRKKELEKSIRAMPGVRRASVNINYGSERTIRGVPRGVSASVAVDSSRANPLVWSTALAIGNLVAGATNGLTIAKVRVIDTTHGRPFDLGDEASSISDKGLRIKEAWEAYHEEKIRKGLAPYIPGVVVGVHVKVNTDRKRIDTHTPDPNTVIPGTLSEQTTESGGAASGGEPGVVPNTGVGLSTASTGGAGDKTSNEQVGVPADWGRVDTIIEKTAGAVEQVKATVSVPRSYFVNILRMGTDGADKKIDESKLKTIIDTELAKIAKVTETLIGTAEKSAVNVGWFYDVAADEGAVDDGESVGGLVVAVSRYGPSVGLGVMAVLALLMVYKVVSKVHSEPSPVADAGPVEDSVGEAGLTLDSILEGVELEADTIRTTRMQDQISGMIRDDPESVADLMKRWIAKE
ncbi:MAG: hypothetical protein GWP05_01175 [Anaerolineaceae bacterium]|nr:hypothetical protein [Anaerolineaceae bacterium]